MIWKMEAVTMAASGNRLAGQPGELLPICHHMSSELAFKESFKCG